MTRTGGVILSWGVALVGGAVLGYAFGMLSVALGLDADKNAAPVLVLSLVGVLLGIVARRRTDSGAVDVVCRPPLIPAMLVAAIGATVAMFSAYSTEDTLTAHAAVLVHIVRVAMVFIPISIGVPVGITIRFVYRAMRKTESDNEDNTYSAGPDKEGATSSESVFRSVLPGAAWGIYAWLAVLIGSIWTVGVPVFMGVLKWDALLKQPDYSLQVLFYFVMGLSSQRCSADWRALPVLASG
jgi:hypothetical protein